MSMWNPTRMMLAIAAISSMAQTGQAGCNCSVPPSPGAAVGVPGMGWSDGLGYGGQGYGGPGYGAASTYGYGGMTAYGSAPMPAYAGGAYPNGAYPNGAMPSYGYGGMSGNAYGAMPGYGGVPSYAMSPGSMAGVAWPGATNVYNPDGATWAPGGYEARVGSPVYYHDPAGGQYVVTGNPYNDHFGPGYQRNSLYGHYRFPYYNYRAPWYFPGKAVYNRDTNFPW